MSLSKGVYVASLVCGAVLLQAAASDGLWLDVPFVRQEKDGCGAASMAMVMQYWAQKAGTSPGDRASATHIQGALYSAEARGIFASDMERYFRQNGFRVFTFAGEWSDLQEHIAKGRPLIVALQPGSGAPLHYVVITGLDSGNHAVLVNDPAQRKLMKEDRARFSREWEAAGRWTLLAVPEEKIH
jgi:ABC-type bacteriocin/lantibiotic exporter with double-glycine peptidase domain